MQILCLGDRNQFHGLFDRINKQSGQDTSNRIDISFENKSLVRIDTKYYTIELDFKILSDKELDKESKPENIQKIQAVLVLVDKNNYNFVNSDKVANFFEKLYKEEQTESILSILLSNNVNCESCTDVSSFLEKYEHFTNIKLDDQENEDFSSIEELINSFYVHSWSGMSLKSEKKTETRKESEKMIEKPSEKISDEPLNELNENEFNFENLLMNLKEIREKANNLSFEERKKYAETVAINFWKSIGGDMDEIGDLDDEDD